MWDSQEFALYKRSTVTLYTRLISTNLAGPRSRANLLIPTLRIFSINLTICRPPCYQDGRRLRFLRRLYASFSRWVFHMLQMTAMGKEAPIEPPHLASIASNTVSSLPYQMAEITEGTGSILLPTDSFVFQLHPTYVPIDGTKHSGHVVLMFYTWLQCCKSFTRGIMRRTGNGLHRPKGISCG